MALWTRLGRVTKLLGQYISGGLYATNFWFGIETSMDFVLSFRYIEMYLRPPAQQDTSKISDWIRMRQCGIRYELAEGYQRIVDKHFIIRPRAEFEVRDFTLDIGLSSYIYELFYRRGHSR